MTQSESPNVGLLLRKAREQLGLSINDVAVATKINPRILKALEDGQRELLPAKSFTRGFIRTYATYLKIDPRPILDGYDGATITEPVAPVETSTTVQSAPPIKKSGYTRPSSSSKIFLVASILFLVALIIGIKKVVDKYAHERTVETAATTPVTSPLPSPMPTETLAVSATPTPTGTASPTTTADDADDDDSPTITAAAGNAPAPTPTVSAQPTPKPSVASAKKPVEKPTPKPTEAPAAKTADVKPPAEKTEAAKGKPQEVIIEALDTVDITIQVDNNPATTVKLTPESVHTIKAKSQIDLEIADGGMVNLIYNGHERGVPGVLGKPVKLKFP